MATPTYATDLADIVTDMAGTGDWTAIGGGASGLTAPEEDYFIQGSNCISKGAWSSDIKGMIYDYSGSFVVPTSGAVIIWLAYQATNSLDTLAGGGIRVVIGSSDGDFYHYNVAGSDTLVFDIWRPYVVDPNTASSDDQDGTPSGTEAFVGGLADIPASGPSKGSPFAVDAIRYGRCELRYTNGETADYANFDGAAVYAGDGIRQWGLLDKVQGVYYMQGFHSFGLSGAAVDFRDSNRVLFIRDTGKVVAAFNRLEIINSGSNVEWTNISISAQGTQSPGTFIVTAGTFTAIGCTFVDMGTFTFLSTSEALDCIFRGCGQITAAGADLTGSSISGYEGSSDSSALVWDVATDTGGLLDDTTFTKGTAPTHAIELGTSSPTSVTFNGITFSGYNPSDDQTDSTIYVKRISGTVTIYLAGVSGNVSYKTDGADVVISSDPVATMITVKDINTQAIIEDARVLLIAADGTGDFPYQEAVTEITSTGGTATVTHTSHGMATGDFAYVEGANEDEYNGAFEITVTGVDAYTYVVPGTPGSPATGTIIATGGYFNTLTNSSGMVADSRAITNSQPVTGRVRLSSGATLYKNSPVSGEVDNSTGFSATVYLIPDS
jgi:hypothetical protein